MSADLYIHIFEGITEEDLSNLKCNCIGSKYFDMSKEKDYGESYDKTVRTPSVWIGEVSWLKASIMEDNETYIPSTVEEINELVGEDLPIINDDFIAKVIIAFNLENKTQYNLSEPEIVIAFLEQHKGKRVFCISA